MRCASMRFAIAALALLARLPGGIAQYQDRDTQRRIQNVCQRVPPPEARIDINHATPVNL